MARAISTNGKTTLNLSGTQKDALQKLAERFGSSSISSFVAAIAEGRLIVIDGESKRLMDAIVSFLTDHNFNELSTLRKELSPAPLTETEQE